MQAPRVPLRVSGVSGGALRAARRGVASAPRGARRVRSRSSTVLVHAAGPSGVKVVGVGSAGVDYLASIASFPEPDAKLRTDALEVQGGGNCGNACTAMARLGLSPSILTKLSDDGAGKAILDEFAADGVDTSAVVIEPGKSSPFTYIIVDRAGSTRTCIHTPGPEFRPSEFTPDAASSLVDGAALVYFDGRLTEVALNVAAAAREKDIPVLVEGERTRDNLPELLRMGDYVCTSAGYPKEYTGEASTETAMVKLFAELPRARAMVTTLGKRGAVMLRRVNDWDGEETRATLRETLARLETEATAATAAARARIRRGPHPRAPRRVPDRLPHRLRRRGHRRGGTRHRHVRARGGNARGGRRRHDGRGGLVHRVDVLRRRRRTPTRGRHATGGVRRREKVHQTRRATGTPGERHGA